MLFQTFFVFNKPIICLAVERNDLKLVQLLLEKDNLDVNVKFI